jgi:uncharacterized cupin superfamily protein
VLNTIRNMLSVGNGSNGATGADGITWFNANDGAIASVPVNGAANGAANDAAPIVRALERLASIDGSIASGVWDSTAGKQEFEFEFDEILYFLEGEVHVTASGKTYTFRAGDVAFVPAGTHMSWDVPRYIRKVWIHRYPRRMRIKRALRKLRDVALRVEQRV